MRHTTCRPYVPCICMHTSLHIPAISIHACYAMVCCVVPCHASEHGKAGAHVTADAMLCYGVLCYSHAILRYVMLGFVTCVLYVCRRACMNE